MFILDSSRRAYVHTVSVALIGVLAAFTVIGSSLVPLIPAAIVAVFDLLVALAHREVTDWQGRVSTAVYALALAAQPIGLALAFGTDAQWAVVIQLLAALLGGGLAGARAPQPAGTSI